MKKIGEVLRRAAVLLRWIPIRVVTRKRLDRLVWVDGAERDRRALSNLLIGAVVDRGGYIVVDLTHTTKENLKGCELISTTDLSGRFQTLAVVRDGKPIGTKILRADSHAAKKGNGRIILP